MSTVFELAGFACVIAGVYLLLGLGACLLTAGVVLWLVAQALDGLQPVKLARAVVSDARTRRAARSR